MTYRAKIILLSHNNPDMNRAGQQSHSVSLQSFGTLVLSRVCQTESSPRSDFSQQVEGREHGGGIPGILRLRPRSSTMISAHIDLQEFHHMVTPDCRGGWGWSLAGQP